MEHNVAEKCSSSYMTCMYADVLPKESTSFHKHLTFFNCSQHHSDASTIKFTHFSTFQAFSHDSIHIDGLLSLEWNSDTFCDSCRKPQGVHCVSFYNHKHEINSALVNC